MRDPTAESLAGGGSFNSIINRCYYTLIPGSRSTININIPVGTCRMLQIGCFFMMSYYTWYNAPTTTAVPVPEFHSHM